MSDRHLLVRFAALAAGVMGLMIVVLVIGVPAADGWAVVLEGLGWWGPAVAVVGSAVLVGAMVPRALLAAAGGLLFGLVSYLYGVTSVSLRVFCVGTVIGAAPAPWCTRVWGRPHCRRVHRRSPSR